ncbi:MAG: hypothetical protein RR280_10470, partial [Bacteroidaceae bacterium]
MLTIWSSENIGDLPSRVGITGCNVGTGYQPPNPEDGTVMLCMGTKVLNELIKIGVVPKNRTIGSTRNKP